MIPNLKLKFAKYFSVMITVTVAYLGPYDEVFLGKLADSQKSFFAKDLHLRCLKGP